MCHKNITNVTPGTHKSILPNKTIATIHGTINMMAQRGTSTFPRLAMIAITTATTTIPIDKKAERMLISPR